MGSRLNKRDVSVIAKEVGVPLTGVVKAQRMMDSFGNVKNSVDVAYLVNHYTKLVSHSNLSIPREFFTRSVTVRESFCSQCRQSPSLSL